MTLTKGDTMSIKTFDAQTYVAYDVVTEWQSRATTTEEHASRLARAHNRRCGAVGGYGSAVVCVVVEGRLYDTGGGPIWPPHGRSTGAVQYRE